VKLIQIACTQDVDGEPLLFALDEQGIAWHAWYDNKRSEWAWRTVNPPNPEGA